MNGIKEYFQLLLIGNLAWIFLTAAGCLFKETPVYYSMFNATTLVTTLLLVLYNFYNRRKPNQVYLLVQKLLVFKSVLLVNEELAMIFIEFADALIMVFETMFYYTKWILFNLPPAILLIIVVLILLVIIQLEGKTLKLISILPSVISVVIGAAILIKWILQQGDKQCILGVVLLIISIIILYGNTNVPQLTSYVGYFGAFHVNFALVLIIKNITSQITAALLLMIFVLQTEFF